MGGTRQISAEQDYYSVLEVAPTASDSVIEAAFRALARKWHPDTVSFESGLKPAYGEKFKSLGEARDVLLDPELRSAYDRLRMDRMPPAYAPPAPAPVPAPVAASPPAPPASSGKPPLSGVRLSGTRLLMGVAGGWAILWTVLFVAYLILKAAFHVG